MNDRFDHHPDDDELVGFLRSTDPGEPPVTLGPGSALRRRAAVRHARRQAAGAVLAVVMIGIAVAGSVVGTRHHSTTTAARLPLAGSSVGTSAHAPATATAGVPAASASAATFTVSAPTPSGSSESARPDTPSVAPAIPEIETLSWRDPGPIAAGESVYYTVRYSVRGDVVPSWTHVEYGDGTTADAPIGLCVSSSALSRPPRSGSITGEITTPSHTYTAPGTYAVRIIVELGCVKGSAPSSVTRTVRVAGTASPSPSVPASPSATASSSPAASDSATPSP